MTPEEWTKQWDEYFDDLDKAIDKIDELSEKAEDEGLQALSAAIFEAARHLGALSIKVAQFVDIKNFETVAELYSQNPLLRLLLKSDMATSPYTEQIEAKKQ